MGVRMRKVTVAVPASLLKRAMAATGNGITATIRQGLEAVTASRAYEYFRTRRGKLKLDLDVDALREDR